MTIVRGVKSLQISRRNGSRLTLMIVYDWGTNISYVDRIPITDIDKGDVTDRFMLMDDDDDDDIDDDDDDNHDVQ